MRSRVLPCASWSALLVASAAGVLAVGCGGERNTPPVTADAGDTRDTSAADDAATDDGALVDLVTPTDVGTVADVAAPEDRVVAMDRVAVEDRATPVDVGAEDRGTPTDRGAATDRGMPGDVAMADSGVMVGPYPAGPYGIREGDVLRDLEWAGYVNLAGGVISTMRPYGRTSMQAMRETGRRYAMVHVSEFF